MTLAPAPGSPTPPIEISGGAAEATGRLAAPVVLLHVGAALKHQWIDRDGLLSRMLPGRR